MVTPIEDILGDARTSSKTSCAASSAPTRTLSGDRRKLLERYRYVHAARKVVGVGSVGTRAYIMLLLGRDDDDPLFLQFKEAEASVPSRSWARASSPTTASASSRASA